MSHIGFPTAKLMAETSSPRIPRYAVVAVVLCGLSILALRWWATSPPPESKTSHKAQPAADSTVIAPAPVKGHGPITAAQPQPVAKKRQKGEALLEAKWGGGKDQLGLSRPSEGNPEAPMSFAVDPSGGVWVLDQVNDRLVRYGPDGKVVSERPLSERVPQDIALAPDGSLAVLDRLGDKTITMYGPEGDRRGAIPLEGKGIDETGAVTGVFVDGDDVYAEVEHGTLVSVGKTDGTSSEDREQLPGRPSRDGRLLLSAGITQAAEGRMWVSAVRRDPIEHQFTRELRVAGEILYLLLLDSDRLGTIYVAALHTPAPEGTPMVTLMCLEPAHGEPLGSVALPANTSADETFRDMTVLDEGGVVYAVRTEEGVSYRYYPCP